MINDSTWMVDNKSWERNRPNKDAVQIGSPVFHFDSSQVRHKPVERAWFQCSSWKMNWKHGQRQRRVEWIMTRALNYLCLFAKGRCDSSLSLSCCAWPIKSRPRHPDPLRIQKDPFLAWLLLLWTPNLAHRFFCSKTLWLDCLGARPRTSACLLPDTMYLMHLPPIPIAHLNAFTSVVSVSSAASHSISTIDATTATF